MNSWIITVFANKIEKLECVYKLWEEIIKVNDNFFLCFLSVALLILHKDMILTQEDSNVLVYLGGICIREYEDIEKLITTAKEIMGEIPSSIRVWMNAFDVFNLDRTENKILEIESFWIFSMLPCEFLKTLYPEKFQISRNRISFVLIDCRTEREQKSGHFPNSALFQVEDLPEASKIRAFVNRFIGVKGFSHFIIMGYKEIKQNNPATELIQCFLQQNFPFVSTAKGGFKESHEFSKKNSLKIKHHNSDMCRICAKRKKTYRKLSDYLWTNKKKKHNADMIKESDYKKLNI